MRAAGFPVFEYQQMARAADLRAIEVRRVSLFAIDFYNFVVAVTIAATRRIDQSGDQQSSAMLTCYVAVDQARRLIVTAAAHLDLINRRDHRGEFRYFVDLMLRPVTVDAAGLLVMNAATDFAHRAAMTLGADGIAKRFSAVLAVLRRQVRMTVSTDKLGVCCGTDGDRIMAFCAVAFLCVQR